MATVKPYDTVKGVRYRVRYRTPDGSQTDKRGFLTKDEANGFAATVEVDKREGRYIAPAAGRATIGDLAQRWYESRIDLTPSSLERYRQTLENQVIPRWDHVYVSNVTTDGIQDWITALAKERGPSTVKKAHHALSMILDVAVRDRRIGSNPAVGIRMPKQVAIEPVFLSRTQIFELAELSGPGELVVLVIGFCGLRWGELAAMKVHRWNASTRRLHVAQSVTDVNGHVVWGLPKYGKKRNVPVPMWLAARIDESAAGKEPEDLLFPSPHGSVLRNQNARRHWFDGAVLAMFPPKQVTIGVKPKPSLNLTPHKLRHSAASIAIAAGADAKVVQAMLGHASAAMTLDIYSHLFEDQLNDVADRIEGPPAKKVVGLRVVPGL